MVEAEILAGSDGRLIPSKVEPDVDHRDILVAELGGFGALWLQVKGTPHLDDRGRIVAIAHFPKDAIPESSRLLYVICLLDIVQHQLSRIWLVPSSDFNRLASREAKAAEANHVILRFRCRATGDKRWDPFEIPRLELAARLEPLIAALGLATAEELSALRDQIPSGLGLSV